MPDARYFIPEHASLKDVYSKDDLRGLLQAGRLSRSDILVDDQTGLAHLLGDLLMSAYRETRAQPLPTATDHDDEPPRQHEFRADTPLPRPESDLDGEEDDDLEDDDLESSSEEDEEEEEDEEAPEELSRGRTQPAVEERRAGPEREQLLYYGHPSWRAYPKSIMALFAFAAAAWLFHQLHADLAWVIVSGALAILPLLFVALDRTTTNYVITTRRVETESGIIGRSSKEIRIADIRAIDVVQQGFNALVGIGNVVFDSAAGPDAEVEFINVRRPHDLKHAVRELQR